MEYFSVRNWKKHQHYKHRNPPWIRIYNDLLGKGKFMRLSPEYRYAYMAILLLASRCNNKIDYDEKFVAQQIGVESIDLSILEDANFIVKIQPVTKTLAPCTQNVTTETETETEKSKDNINNILINPVPDDLANFNFPRWILSGYTGWKDLELDCPRYVLENVDDEFKAVKNAFRYFWDETPSDVIEKFTHQTMMAMIKFTCPKSVADHSDVFAWASKAVKSGYRVFEILPVCLYCEHNLDAINGKYWGLAQSLLPKKNKTSKSLNSALEDMRG